MRFVAPTWFPWRFPCVPRAPNITQRRPHEAQEAPQRSQITSKEDKHLSGNWIHDEIFDFKIDWKTNEKLIMLRICRFPNRSENDQTLTLRRRSFSDVICGRIWSTWTANMRFVAPTFAPWRFPCIPRAPNIVPKQSNDAQQAIQITSKEDEHLFRNKKHDDFFGLKFAWKTLILNNKPINKRSNIDFKATFVQRYHLWNVFGRVGRPTYDL
jgi:hypothetical protein